MINELNIEKDMTEGSEINSSIRSKYKISRKVESQSIKNINKFWGNVPEDIIADELYTSKTTVRTYINDIYFEIGILATFNNLINKSMFAS